ncbi:hypothetical protein HC823_00295 [Candidatus Gracilibacteria bacterium]|nr:hypothetical protein [Candidatus Gracilibacteria bacterium]
MPSSEQNDKVEAKLFLQKSDQDAALKMVKMHLENATEYTSRQGFNLRLKNKMTLGGTNNWNFTFQFDMPNTNALGQFIVMVRDGKIDDTKFSERMADGTPVK